MKNFIKTLFVLAIISLVACNSKKEPFSDSEYVADFEARRTLLGDAVSFSVFDKELTSEENHALQFLYAYMPLPDAVDYSGDFYYMNVHYALKARAEMPWGSIVPDREFLHFVLPVRVNNENMDESRKVFYEELKERVQGLSMYDAVLEVNHWCHEKVTYTPSDERTSSPLATVRTAYGRCGEESTFTVAALRAVGIPARQVYTPRWAHTDNNHAWVEAWVDGEWRFLGACEPEPVLDLGWFNAPASRGMLMHTKAFGAYNGPEEVISVTPCYTEINVTSNYAPVSTTNVLVVDEVGNPVQATVDFKIYNYAEFFTAAVKQCNDEGRTSITTGHGNMIAWAYKDGKFGYTKFSAGKEKDVTVVLDKAPGYSATVQMDIVPPVERNTVPELTPQQVQCNAERFAREDSIRNAYVASFPTAGQVTELANTLGVNPVHLVRLIEQSRGNHATITEFLRNCPSEGRNKAMAMLSSLSDKDRCDVSIEVLNDHLPAALKMDEVDNDCSSIYWNFVAQPRVSNEMLTPYRSFFTNVIPADDAEMFRENPEQWVAWCRQNIKIDNTLNPLMLCMSPIGVWNSRITDNHSRDIFFVSAARSMGIPARIDGVTGKLQYRENISSETGSWIDVNFGSTTAKSAPQGAVKVAYTPSSFIDNPKYYSHYTISKIVDGRLQLLGYTEGATTWQSHLKNGTSLDTGDYLMITGTRMASGGVLAHLTFFSVAKDSTTKLQMVQRESKDDLSVIGDFNSENLYNDLATNSTRSLLSTTGRGYYIIALIDPNSEPINHFLRDVMPYKEQFEAWGQKMVLLFEDTSAAQRFKADDFPNLPSTVVMGTDINGTIQREIVSNMKLKTTNRPIILVADTFNRVVFMSQGYSIGLGEQLIKVINKLQK